MFFLKPKSFYIRCIWLSNSVPWLRDSSNKSAYKLVRFEIVAGVDAVLARCYYWIWGCFTECFSSYLLVVSSYSSSASFLFLFLSRTAGLKALWWSIIAQEWTRYLLRYIHYVKVERITRLTKDVLQ